MTQRCYLFQLISTHYIRRIARAHNLASNHSVCYAWRFLNLLFVVYNIHIFWLLGDIGYCLVCVAKVAHPDWQLAHQFRLIFFYCKNNFKTIFTAFRCELFYCRYRISHMTCTDMTNYYSPCLHCFQRKYKSAETFSMSLVLIRLIFRTSIFTFFDWHHVR